MTLLLGMASQKKSRMVSGIITLLLTTFASRAQAATIPVAATDVAHSWDQIYWFLIWISAFFFVGIVLAMIIFAVKYRKSVHPKSKYIHGHTGLEIVWTVIPTILVLWIFWWGWNVYKEMTHAPADAMEIHVVAKQWMWQFVYKNGTSSIGDLYVPVNKPVKLVMSAEDVLHSMFIPNFRVKSDVVPGMYTYVWFEAKIPGIHQIFCTEYCGTSHSGMLGRVVVLTPEQWKDWMLGKKIDVDSLAADPTYPGYRANHLGEGLPTAAAADGKPAGQLSLAEKGKGLTVSKGCVACHSADGSKLVGPSYKGIFGHEVKLADGSTVTVDENYIRESIENPTAKVVEGFAPSMPPYKGLVTEEEITNIVEYIKSLKD
jgi:cytochrome c oxidase subunit 2